ncbi:MAG: YncE family protein [Rhodospirillales bacterium]
MAAPEHRSASRCRPDGTEVFVTDDIANTVSVIATASNTVVATIPVGTNPQGIVVGRGGNTVYAANVASDNVSVISTATNAVTSTIDVGTAPVGVSVGPNGKTLYVANSKSNTVSIISTATGKLTGTVNVGNYPVAFGAFTDAISAPCTVGRQSNVFKYTGGVQSCTIPFTGSYAVSAMGANGGNAHGGAGGQGAYVQSVYQFTAGQVLNIVVGGAGSGGSLNIIYGDTGGGGGGATTVSFPPLPNTVFPAPFIIAGGGGGAGEGTVGGPGLGLETSTGSAGNGSGSDHGNGGSRGNGGFYSPDEDGGSGGGGFYSPGGYAATAQGGVDLQNGGYPGNPIVSYPQAYVGGAGGFGGGGAGAGGQAGGGGGGGGYSGGGGGGSFSIFSTTGGGGGGDFLRTGGLVRDTRRQPVGQRPGRHSGGTVMMSPPRSRMARIGFAMQTAPIAAFTNRSHGFPMRISARSTTLGLAFCAMLAAGGHAHAGSCASASPNGPTAFTFSGRIVVCTIPATGVYSLSAWGGANGGPSIGGSKGGVGTFVSANMNLTAGRNCRSLWEEPAVSGRPITRTFTVAAAAAAPTSLCNPKPRSSSRAVAAARAPMGRRVARVCRCRERSRAAVQTVRTVAPARVAQMVAAAAAERAARAAVAVLASTPMAATARMSGGGQGITSGGAGGVCFSQTDEQAAHGRLWRFRRRWLRRGEYELWRRRRRRRRLGRGGGGGDNTIPPDGGGGGGGGSYVNANVAVAVHHRVVFRLLDAGRSGHGKRPSLDHKCRHWQQPGERSLAQNKLRLT